MTPNNQRLLSLDILRGITVAGMILVNNGYGQSFEMLEHSTWNGMTPCDLVFPFFLFIMGISCYLSLHKSEFRPTAPVVRRIMKRTVLLFAIGLFINWFDLAIGGDLPGFDHLRLWAVLQRIALTYGFVSLFALYVPHRYTLPVGAALLAAYAAILVVGNGYAEDAGMNIVAQVDLRLFGADHLYGKGPVDPEGLLGVISSVAHGLLGFYCGRLIAREETVERKVVGLFVVGTALVIGGYLLSYGLPLNKRIWSPSYVMVTCGLASLLQALLMYVIDIRQQSGGWTSFFRVFGVNALALYVSSELLSILLGHAGVSGWVFGGISRLIAYPQAASLAYALYFVLLNFAIGYLLYRRRIYIKL